MISVEQIRQLQSKVQSAVEVIEKLRSENSLLAAKLTGYEKRIEELEVFIESYKRDQSSIEEGIIDALHKLDSLEDSILTENKTGSERPNSGKMDKAPEISPESEEDTEEQPEEKNTELKPEDQKENSETVPVENELDIF